MLNILLLLDLYIILLLSVEFPDRRVESSDVITQKPFR